MTRLLTVDEALERVLARVARLGVEDVPLETALGRVLAEDVVADADSPAWPRSRVDGYALFAGDAPGTLDVVCEVPAGKAPGDRIGRGQAARVFTGAAVPQGADAVAKQEDVHAEGRRVTLREPLSAGENVTPPASECAAGEPVAARGAVITPGMAGALASVGRARVVVAATPNVVIVSTGSELVPVDEVPGPGKIRNSNAPALRAAMQACGAAGWIHRAIVPDDRAALEAALSDALRRSPSILLVTGGVSVGDYDLVPAALAAAGAEVDFHGVSLQPGKPLWFGVRDRTLVFGLPGNPVSALVNAALFVAPALRKMVGRADVAPEVRVATLGGKVGPGTWRRRFVPAALAYDDGRLVVTPVRFAGSGDVFGFARADALVIVPENAPARERGERAEVVVLPGRAH